MSVAAGTRRRIMCFCRCCCWTFRAKPEPRMPWNKQYLVHLTCANQSSAATHYICQNLSENQCTSPNWRMRGSVWVCSYILISMTHVHTFSIVPSTGFSSQGRAKLSTFPRRCTAENTQLSPSVTRKPCTSPWQTNGVAARKKEQRAVKALSLSLSLRLFDALCSRERLTWSKGTTGGLSLIPNSHTCRMSLLV